MKKNRLDAIIPLMLISVVLSCTSNPFFKDDAIKSKDVVSGVVTLSDGTDPENVFVWFEQNGISTRTDGDGAFKLVLPSPASQTGGGWTGQFTCYFYMAGYIPDSVEVWLRDGYIEWGKGAVDTKGEINKEIVLRKNLKTSLTIEPQTVFADFSGEVEGRFSVQAIEEKAHVKIPYTYKNTNITRYILEMPGEEGYPKFIEHPTISGISESSYSLQPGESLNLTLLISWPPLAGREFWTYLPGDYQFLPCFWIQPDDLPEAMQEDVKQYFTFDKNYLDYPMVLPVGRMTVRSDSTMTQD